MKSLCKLILVVGLATAMFAQNSSKTTSDQPARKDTVDQEGRYSGSYFRLNFAINEVEDGKRVNQREYSIIAASNDGRPVSLKAATRVPIVTGDKNGDKQFTYLDAGLDIRCLSVREVAGKLVANCDVVISNIVPAEKGSEARNDIGPVIRTINSSAWAVLVPGKPSVVSTIDDLNSKRRIQVEMTATKID